MDLKIKNSALNNEKPCWRKNGVWGTEQPRCEKLKFVEHCRYCEVFEDAARGAMVGHTSETDDENMSLTIDDLVQQQRLEGDKSILAFRLEKYCFAIPSNKVVTVHEQTPIHSIPFNRNNVIKGVVAINHEIYTFVNIVQLLSLPPVDDSMFEEKPRGIFKRALVIDFGNRTLAFYVDEVYQIYRYYNQSVNEELPGSFLHAISKGRLLKEKSWCDDCHLLDLEKISSEFERTFL